MEKNWLNNYYLRNNNSAKEQLRKDAQERKKCLLYLILNYLIDNNLHETVKIFENETQIKQQYELCDNIDLDIILQEYQSYYYTKFQKFPKILRKIDETIINERQISGNRKLKKFQQNIDRKKSPTQQQQQRQHDEDDGLKIKEDKNEDFQFNIIAINNNKQNYEEIESETDQNIQEFFSSKNYSKEHRELANDIINECLIKYNNNNNIKWNDCVGMNDSIELLKEAIIYPIIYPKLFENIQTWNNILLYGPPGCGKTLLAKALINEKLCNFINITASTFISKWRGESEKLLKILFDIANYFSPTTIFIDEIDSLMSLNNNIHEASKRFKSELLIQIDGINTNLDKKIFLLATTNSPWNLDLALLRRFDKRIFIQLPNSISRKNILLYYLNKVNNNQNNFDILNNDLIKLTTNFSCSDLKNFIKEVEMNLIREKLQNKQINTNQLRKITINDLMLAFNKIKPSIDIKIYEKYYEWTTKFGVI